MKVLNEYPMARILFPFLGGIILAPILPDIIGLWVSVLSGFVLLFILWLFLLKKYHTYKWRWISGFLISLQLFSIGIIGFWYHSPLHHQNHYRNTEEGKAYLIEITSPFSETAKTYKSIGKIKAILAKNDSNWQVADGRIILYFQKQDDFLLTYGDKIICTSKLNPIQGALNPHAFDYGKYMKRKGIFDQVFIKENEWKKIDSPKAKNIYTAAILLRKRLLNILNDLHYERESRALAAALLIGYDEYLDDNLRAKFSGSGAMHILCVSGLHVGIIFMLSNFILSFLGRIRFGNELKTLLILLIIWFYALITGLAPSVMRAATMFSFMIAGKLINRKGNTYNSLAASALLLLLVDPNLIYNIGFQLSYGAVFAILYIQPKLYGLFYFGNIVLRKIWALLCVSFAAQMGTFPLAIYYFHQFPNYFLLTNLWVIPFAFIVITGGLIVLLIGLIGLSSSLIGKISAILLKYSLIGLNKGVEIINQIPYSVSNNLALSQFEVFLFYVFLFALSSFFLFKKRHWLFTSFLSLFLILISFINTNTNYLKTNTWIVYKTQGLSAMDFISKRKSFLIGDSAFVNNPEEQKFILAENHIKNGINESHHLKEFPNADSAYNPVECCENIILFQSLRILYLDKKEKLLDYKKPLNIDFVVITNDANVNLKRLGKQYRFSNLIFDSSNHWWKVKQLKLEADSLGISYWDVNEKGAFVYALKNP